MSEEGIYIIIGIVIGAEILRRLSTLGKNETITDSSRKDGQPTKGYGCPSCFAEYQPDFDTCADCNVPLVHFDGSSEEE